MAYAFSFKILAAYWLVTRELLLLAATGIAISSIDDLFIDIVYWTRRFWRRLTIYEKFPRMRAESLPRAEAPGRIAVFVPAWDEAEVIAPMLRTYCDRWMRAGHRIFVGVYPNDPATADAAASVADRRTEIVEMAVSGPTTKADCLNGLWHAMLRHEIASGESFKAVVLHDAEDVAHSRELDLFDFLIPKLAMVQLPVVPIVDRESRWIAGHYLDEFAESHGKDLVVREALGAAVPSAGVACAFDRQLLGEIAEELGGAPFDPGSLTEDYELGLRIAAHGGRGAMVRMPAGEGVVLTREHFPATLDAALRQKTRWLVGIALAGWDRVRWQGGLADRYFLLRDRKALLNALIVVAAYVATLAYGGALVLQMTAAAAQRLPDIVEQDSMLRHLLWLTSGLLCWRLAMRALFTGAQHGWAEGLRAIPRALVANIVNMLAAFRAIRTYVRIVAGRERMHWDKTRHRFPGVVPAE